MDSFSGFDDSPVSLNKYIFANANPSNLVDPSGEFGLPQLSTAGRVLLVLGSAESVAYLTSAGGDSTNGRGHYYEFVSESICNSGLACTRENIFNLLKEFPAPSPYLPLDPPATDESRILAQWPSVFPIGFVTHRQYPAVGRIVNTTIAWQHFMHNGTVTRSIESYGTGFRIRTVGEGVNYTPVFAFLNRFGGKKSFEGLDEKTKRAYRNKYQ